MGPAPNRARRPPTPLAQAVEARAWNLDRLGRLAARATRRFDFGSAGSSGRPPGDLFDALRNPILDSELIVDVRERPMSQHTPAWNKSALERLARARGVGYLHRPDLGVPPEIRRRLGTGSMSPAELFTWYGRAVATPDRLDALRPLLPRRPVFLCTELSPAGCHRGRLVQALEERLGLVSFDL